MLSRTLSSGPLFRRLRWLGFTLTPVLSALSIGAGCGHQGAPSPYATDADDGGAEGGTGGSEPGDAGADVDPTLGGPCLDDGQCNDGIDCTFDTCDQSLGLCRNIPDDSKCQDGVYCNGFETCQPKHGCVPGSPITCSTG